MGERILTGLLALAGTLLLAACGNAPPQAGNVTEARLLTAEDDPDNWLSHGRTYAEQRFSPLAFGSPTASRLTSLAASR